MAQGAEEAVPRILLDLLTRADVVSRLRSGSEARLLQSILDAAVALFHARAGSIALLTAGGDALEFTVAGGGEDAVLGLRIGTSEGIAGYVFQTGEGIVIADPQQDPRFHRAVAEQTGLLPDSLLAVPLQTRDRTIGVLEILDCRDGVFPSNAIELASLFARQAAEAIEATRVEREFPILLAKTLESYDLDADEATRHAVESLPARATDDFWDLVDAIASLAQASPQMRAFISELLPVVQRHVTPSRERRFAR